MAVSLAAASGRVAKSPDQAAFADSARAMLSSSRLEKSYFCEAGRKTLRAARGRTGSTGGRVKRLLAGARATAVAAREKGGSVGALAELAVDGLGAGGRTGATAGTASAARSLEIGNGGLVVP